jgi:CTD small phosphatase-like protein 2
MSLSPKVVLRSDFPRTNSQRELKSDLSRVVTQVKQEAVPATSDRLYQEHLFNTFQAVKFIRNLKHVDTVQLAAKMVVLPRLQYPRKTVVFDLDETLVHCVEDVSRAHIAVPITFPTGERLIAGVNIRPYARECLAAVSNFCEVVVFTASQRCYADQVLDYLDPNRTAISLRLYRDSCVTTDGVYIKDLRILGNRRLQDIVIVDNAAYSFGYQLDNGVPIIAWYEDPRDRELYNLVDYLRSVTLAEDIRPVNRETFHLYRFYDDYLRDCKRLN